MWDQKVPVDGYIREMVGEIHGDGIWNDQW